MIAAEYERLRAAGLSHRRALIASRAKELCNQDFCVGLSTDTSWRAGLNGRDEFRGVKWLREKAERKARAAGVNPTGKRFMSQLARFEDDPQAWVDSKADIKRVCEKEGFRCRGAVNVEAPERDPEPAKPYRVADDIVDRTVREKLIADGVDKVSKAEFSQLKEQASRQLAGVEGE